MGAPSSPPEVAPPRRQVLCNAARREEPLPGGAGHAPQPCHVYSPALHSPLERSYHERSNQRIHAIFYKH